MYQTNTRDLIIKLPQSNKTESFLMNKFSNQDEVQQLQQQFSQQLDRHYNALLADEQAKLDQYVEVHQGLEALKEEIESEPITLNIDKLPDIKATLLERAKNDEHSDKIEKLFDRLEQALNGTNRLYTQLSLIGTRTHRITTKNFNLQGLPKAVQHTILPSKFKKVYTVDFKSFEPSVVAYMTQDSKLIDFLNQKDGLYDALLSELGLPYEQRVFVKRAFIGSFLFGGNFNSPKFKLNQYVSEVQWLDAVSQFTKVIELKKHIDENKSMPMPYGIEHDMNAFQGSSIMAFYVQTVASYIFKHILLEAYKAQCEQKTFKIIVPIHDAIMIECDDEVIARDVAQLMKDTANQLFNGEFAYVTVEELGGEDHE
ncbi:DNA polymerase [Staphylococcus sp. KG4-3]|uniref:DNA polymerase n=1 Tax=Staphylococcus sp. KG4-3 TaxID=3093634 RepID=UPI00298EFD5F|nr:DNA polymerase [Staphylococcus sp. KG4-3]MDW8543469.1 DNA polymerase [Staphylococcus sp. KG4-1]MDW8562893.1 DNA polymerase [Staphylococcus sp. KG4-3]